LASAGLPAWGLRLLGEIAAHSRPRTSRQPTGGIARRWRSPTSSACALSSPTATSASATFTGTGKREQAQEHLTSATTMYREMGMTYWLERATAELKALG
jgi:hypothetical protein